MKSDLIIKSPFNPTVCTFGIEGLVKYHSKESYLIRHSQAKNVFNQYHQAVIELISVLGEHIFGQGKKPDPA